MLDVKKAWEKKKEAYKRSFSLKQLLRNCIVKKANERRRISLRKSPKPTIAHCTKHPEEIPTYTEPMSSQTSMPNTSHCVMVDDHSSPPCCSYHLSGRSNGTKSQSESGFTTNQDSDYTHCVVEPEDIECIELTDVQPTHIETMDEKKREKEEKMKSKEAAKIEKKQREKCIPTRNSKQPLKEITNEQTQAAQPKVEKRVRWASQLVEYLEKDDGMSEEEHVAVIISQKQASIVKFERRIEKLEAKITQSHTELYNVEEQQLEMACFKSLNSNITTLLEDYKLLQLKMQKLKKDIELYTCTIRTFKSAIVKKQESIERMRNSQQMTPITELTHDTTCPVEDKTLSILSHVIVVKEFIHLH